MLALAVDLDDSPRPPVSVSARVASGSRLARPWSSVAICRLAPSCTVPASGASVAGQQVDQRGLAGAVRPDDADPVAAQHARRTGFRRSAARRSFARHSPPRSPAVPEVSPSAAASLTSPAAPRRVAPRWREAREPGHAADIALAPRGDAIAQPMFLRGDLAVELVPRRAPPARAARRARLRTRAKPRSRRRVVPRSSQTVAARQVLQEAPVMADDDQRRAQALQFAFQPFDGRQIEMVGRLVEQQDIGLRRQHAGKRGAARFAAGKRCRDLRRRVRPSCSSR